MRLSALILVMSGLSTQVALAAVTINEVAWMGSVDSANHEWIELYNSGANVSVDGWRLTDGMNLNIALNGSLSANTYAVLERTSDESASGPAFLIYTGALINTGATLVLKDANGNIIDQVSGGENWQNVGGDNVTKETAQYSSQGWVTDTATPGRVNKTGREVVPESNASTDTKTSSSGSGNNSQKVSESVSLRNTETKMVVTPEVQNIAYVNQQVPFKVNMTGVDDHKNKLVNYQWNFGDSHATSGKTTYHSYAYPGKYLVTVLASYQKQEQIAQKEITVLPVQFSLTRNDQGDIQIHNDSSYAVDVSGYTLRGNNAIVLPPHTVVLSKATITVAKERVADSNLNVVFLYDTKKNLVASSNQSFVSFAPNVVTYQSDSISEPVLAKPSVSDNFSFVSEQTKQKEELQDEEKAVGSKVAENLPVQEEPSPSNSTRWPYFALIGLILASLGAIFYGQKEISNDSSLNL